MWKTIFMVLLIALPAFAQVGVNKWPLGDHDQYFMHSDGTLELSHGFDPAFDKSQQGERDTLVSAFTSNGHTTFDVGLPGSIEPDDASLKPFTVTGGINSSNLSAFPSCTLSGVGPVKLIAGYKKCTGAGTSGCEAFEVTGTVKLALVGSAIGLLKKITDSAHPEIWVVDSLIAAQDGQPGCTQWEGDAAHIMYSECEGGDDAAKAHENQDWWRNHIHQPMRSGTGHADGVQGAGPRNIFFMQNFVNHLWKNSNAVLWWSSEGGGAGPIYDYQNMLWGGQSGIRTCEKSAPYPHDWNGRPYISIQNVFGAIATLMSHKYDFYSDCGGTPAITKRGGGNKKLDGTTAGIDTFTPYTAADLTAITDRITTLRTWTSELRACAGLPDNDPDGGSGAPLSATLDCSPNSGNAPLTGVTCVLDPILEGTGPDYSAQLDCDNNGTIEATVNVDNDTSPVANITFPSTACNSAYASAGSYTAVARLNDKGDTGSGGVTIATTTALDQVVVTGTALTFTTPLPYANPAVIQSGDNVTWYAGVTNTVGAPVFDIDKDGNGSYGAGETNLTMPHTAAVTGTDGQVITTKIRVTSAGATGSPITSSDIPITIQTPVGIDGVDLCYQRPGFDCTNTSEGLIEADIQNGPRVFDMSALQKTCINNTTGNGTLTLCNNDADCGGSEHCDVCVAFNVDGNAAIDANEGSVGMRVTVNDQIKKQRLQPDTIGDDCSGDGDCGACPVGSPHEGDWSRYETNSPIGYPEEPNLNSKCMSEIRIPGQHNFTVVAFEGEECGGDIKDELSIDWTTLGSTPSIPVLQQSGGVSIR